MGRTGPSGFNLGLPSLTSSSCSFPRIRSIDLGLVFFFGLQKSSLVYMLREEELGRYCCISSLWLTLPLLRGQLHIRERITDNLSPSVSFFLNFQYHPSFRSDHSYLKVKWLISLSLGSPDGIAKIMTPCSDMF